MHYGSNGQSASVVAAGGTYDDTEGEHVRWLLNWSLCMRFETPPHPVPQLSAHSRCAWRKMRCVLEIGKLYLLNIYPGCAFFRLNQNIVCFHIWNPGQLCRFRNHGVLLPL